MGDIYEHVRHMEDIYMQLDRLDRSLVRSIEDGRALQDDRLGIDGHRNACASLRQEFVSRCRTVEMAVSRYGGKFQRDNEKREIDIEIDRVVGLGYG